MDLQEDVYIQVLKIHYPSAGEAGRGIVDFLDLFIESGFRSKPPYLEFKLAFVYSLPQAGN